MGAEDPRQSVNTTNELEQHSLTQNTQGVAIALNQASTSLLIHYANSAKHRAVQEKLFNALDSVDLGEYSVLADDLSACLSKWGISEHQSFLNIEESFRSSLLACSESADEAGSSDLSLPHCTRKSTYTLQDQLSRLLSQSIDSAIECVKANDEMIATFNESPLNRDEQ